MAELVIDIETHRNETNLDQEDMEYLLSPAEQESDPADQEKRREEIRDRFSLNPFTGEIVCIGMLNPATSRARVLFQADDEEAGNPSPDPGVDYVPFGEESELLERFWELARSYKRIITFNGRGFDVPYLYLRSMLQKVPITRKDWMGNRFRSAPHCDLLDQLVFHSGFARDGALRRFRLDFYCKRFGIESPKREGISGQKIPDLVEAGEHLQIARYCLRDIRATGELYGIWKERFGVGE